MADASKDQINELVSRVTATVVKEMGSASAGNFSVNDLRTQATDLAKVGDSVAWEISYKTSKVGLAELGSEAARAGAAVAWEISYKTSKAGFDTGSALG